MAVTAGCRTTRPAGERPGLLRSDHRAWTGVNHDPATPVAGCPPVLASGTSGWCGRSDSDGTDPGRAAGRLSFGLVHPLGAMPGRLCGAWIDTTAQPSLQLAERAAGDRHPRPDCRVSAPG